MRTSLLIFITFISFNMVKAQTQVRQTAGREQLGDFAPKFAELNDDVLFGEVWSRTDKLGLRDRSKHEAAFRTRRRESCFVFS